MKSKVKDSQRVKSKDSIYKLDDCVAVNNGETEFSVAVLTKDLHMKDKFAKMVLFKKVERGYYIYPENPKESTIQISPENIISKILLEPTENESCFVLVKGEEIRINNWVKDQEYFPDGETNFEKIKYFCDNI